jgi:hypothetical protein
VQQDKDPPGDPRWLNALFWVLGSLYVLTVFANFWSAIASPLLDWLGN